MKVGVEATRNGQGIGTSEPQPPLGCASKNIQDQEILCCQKDNFLGIKKQPSDPCSCPRIWTLGSSWSLKSAFGPWDALGV